MEQLSQNQSLDNSRPENKLQDEQSSLLANNGKSDDFGDEDIMKMMIIILMKLRQLKMVSCIIKRGEGKTCARFEKWS